MKWTLFLAFFGLFGFIPTVAAEEIANSVLSSCIKATVKIGTMNGQGTVISTGTGTIFDQRGYILTNFHVVGNRYNGELSHPNGKVLLATISSAREVAKYNWEGQVVRADPRLDLALIRIKRDRNGNEVKGNPFPAIPIGNTNDLPDAAKVWVLGYPSGVRTVNITTGRVSGFEINLDNEVTMFRTDAEINPGNSGGLMVNSSGELIGIPTLVTLEDNQRVYETIGFARAVNRIPEDWFTTLSQGHIDDYQRLGTSVIPENNPIRERMIGDQFILNRPEVWFFKAPEKPGKIISSKPLLMDITSVDKNGAIKDLVRSNGYATTIEIKEGDGKNNILGIFFRQKTVGDNPLEFEIYFEPKPDIPFPIPTFDSRRKLYTVLDQKRLDIEQTEEALKQATNPIYMAIYEDVKTGLEEKKEMNYTAQAIDRVWLEWQKQGMNADESILFLHSMDEKYINVKVGTEKAAKYDITNKELHRILVTHYSPNISKNMDRALSSTVVALEQILKEKQGSPKPKPDPEPVLNINGKLINAISRTPIQGIIVLGKPDVDILQMLEDSNEGKISDEQLFMHLTLIQTQTDGVFSIGNMPLGDYVGIAISKGYLTTPFQVTPKPDQTDYDLGNIGLRP